MVSRRIVAVLVLLTIPSVGEAQTGQAPPKGDVRAACRKDVDAANPPGSLSKRRGTRQSLIDACIRKRSASVGK